MGARALVAYEDFSGGEWGRIGQHKAAKNQFHGTNVLVYADGQIGPRPGATALWRGASFSFAAPNLPVPHSMGRRQGTGYVWFSFVDGGAMDACWFDTTVAPMTFPRSGRATLTKATTAAAGQIGQSWDSTDGTQEFFISQDSLWLVDIAGNALGKVAGSPPSGRAVVKYGDRLVTASGATLRYSAAADPITWPATNSIIVGDSTIRALYVVRNTLVIVKRDYAVWILTGVPGVNETLRQVLPRRSGHVDTFDFEAADVDTLGRLWMTFPGRDAPSNVTPALFSGSVPQWFPAYEMNAYREPNSYLKWSQQNTARACVSTLATEDSVAVVTASNQTAGDDGNLLVRHNGVWTKHLIQYPDLEHPIFSTHVGDGRIVVAAENTAGNVNGDATAYWEPWSIQAAWDRIPVLGDDFYGLMRLGDDSDEPVDAHFELSEWWDPEGRDVTVTKVVIDLTIANIVGDSGLSPINSSFDLSVIHVGMPNDGDARGAPDRQVTSTATVSIDPNANGAGAGLLDDDFTPYGTQRTITIPISPVQARGFKLKFTSIVGVSFRRITVLGEIDPGRN